MSDWKPQANEAYARYHEGQSTLHSFEEMHQGFGKMSAFPQSPADKYMEPAVDGRTAFDFTTQRYNPKETRVTSRDEFYESLFDLVCEVLGKAFRTSGNKSELRRCRHIFFEDSQPSFAIASHNIQDIVNASEIFKLLDEREMLDGAIRERVEHDYYLASQLCVHCLHRFSFPIFPCKQFWALSSCVESPDRRSAFDSVLANPPSNEASGLEIFGRFLRLLSCMDDPQMLHGIQEYAPARECAPWIAYALLPEREFNHLNLNGGAVRDGQTHIANTSELTLLASSRQILRALVEDADALQIGTLSETAPHVPSPASSTQDLLGELLPPEPTIARSSSPIIIATTSPESSFPPQPHATPENGGGERRTPEVRCPPITAPRQNVEHQGNSAALKSPAAVATVVPNPVVLQQTRPVALSVQAPTRAASDGSTPRGNTASPSQPTSAASPVAPLLPSVAPHAPSVIPLVPPTVPLQPSVASAVTPKANGKANSPSRGVPPVQPVPLAHVPQQAALSTVPQPRPAEAGSGSGSTPPATQRQEARGLGETTPPKPSPQDVAAAAELMADAQAAPCGQGCGRWWCGPGMGRLFRGMRPSSFRTMEARVKSFRDWGQEVTPVVTAYAAAGFYLASAKGAYGPQRTMVIKSFCCDAMVNLLASDLVIHRPSRRQRTSSAGPLLPANSVPQEAQEATEKVSYWAGLGLSSESEAAAAEFLRKHLDQNPGCRWACITALEVNLPPPSPMRLAGLMTPREVADLKAEEKEEEAKVLRWGSDD